MPITKTLNFLPAVFQSDANKKFLNATLDQLVTESNLIPISGYVGRKFAPGFSGISSYIKEPNAIRADYQLEPSVIVKDANTKEVELHVTYPELLQQISNYGGKTINQTRLWSSEYYTYDPKINLDAFINFGEYYWLPNGPDAVDVYAGTVELEKTYYMYPDNGAGIYYVSGYAVSANPDLVLARGGTYTFSVNQNGKPFWIQTNPGLSGTQPSNPNISSREILGVTDNGNDVGTVTFNVPLKTAQDFYNEMPIVQSVDFVTNVEYSNIQGQLLADFITNYGGFDGQTTLIDGKYLIFGTYYSADSSWTHNAVTVPSGERYGIWQINLTGPNNEIDLTYVTAIPENQKVTIRYGVNYGNTEWYTNASAKLVQIPPITADLDTLYYQDGINENQVGVIKLVDANTFTINVETDIIGKQNYVSPNGIIFTNGLKIRFDNSVTPASYQNKEFYVDGVGTSIVLCSVESLTMDKAQSRNNFNPALNFTSAANATLSQSSDQLTITTTDMPDNYGVLYGTFPNSTNPLSLIKQNITLNYPYRGGQNTQGDHASIALSSGQIGVTLPGILINGVSNDKYLLGGYSTKWHYDANQALIDGRDSYGGTVVEGGAYIYRDSTFITSNAWGKLSEFAGGSYTHADGHSKIIGFAKDGYPIYGPYGYDSPMVASSRVTRMTSSYVPNNTSTGRPQALTVTVLESVSNSNTIVVDTSYGLNPGMRIINSTGSVPYNSITILENDLSTIQVSGAPLKSPSNSISLLSRGYTVKLSSAITVSQGDTITFDFLAGAFIEDYAYIENSGTLDRFNGRYCVTPDYPLGTYAYFATQDINNNPVYPYFVGSALYGDVVVGATTSLTTPDYIVINRSSRDLNPWSRGNRWFHREVIETAATYNNTVAILDQNYRATRPIIEFIPNLQLFDFGKNGITPVDLYDTRFTQPFLQVEGQKNVTVDGVTLVDGMRVIFGSDTDPTTYGKIWIVNFVDVVGVSANDETVIHLTEEYTPAENDTVSILNGVEYAGKSFWFTGTEWNRGQTKNSLNQSPLFDVFDENGISLSDKSKYPVVNTSLGFNGTKVFSYKLGTGSNDAVLGFPLTYKNFNNIGDIQFENNFDVDTFLYTVDGVNYTENINRGSLYLNNIDGTSNRIDVWTTVTGESRQYQNIAYDYDGINNSFDIDIVPDISNMVPNMLVFVGFKKLQSSDYQIFNLPGNKQQIAIRPTKIKNGDRINILVYSSTNASALGYYEVPDNLNLNAQNEPCENLTLGELRNHISSMVNQSTQFYGDFPGTNNLRDIVINNRRGTMLQQSAPVNYAGLFLADGEHNFVTSLTNAKTEYTRFKNKFITAVGQSRIASYTEIPKVVDNIIKSINVVKNKSFPWYYSDMVPYGDNKNIITYNVFDPAQTRYEITEIFSNEAASNKAILVYLNGNQLIYEKDYTFLSTLPGISITYPMEVDDTITIVEYYNTDGCYIPETPTKLGLYPKFVPERYTDTTYVTPQTFIKGHDGSLTPAFGDYRDDALLELEKRIFNNIKTSYDEQSFSIYNSIPGKFRDNGYSLTDFNAITLQTYLQWAGLNGLNYTVNDSFAFENPFTYNYSQALATDGTALPGSWRACFKYYYDTLNPNTRPWEMLGFSNMPSWWESYYGPAPYTRGNTILWNDLENGYIADGVRKGIDPKFARPGLTNIIPVDDNGKLLSPLGLLSNNYNAAAFDGKWAVGQWSPVETAWRNSSEYPFAVMYASAMTQPAKFFALGIATNKYRYNTTINQYTVKNSTRRITPADIDINGYENTNGTISRAAGYINWIGDYLISIGKSNRTSLYHYIKDHTVQLSYKMAGFTGKNYLKVLAEQNSPDSINESVIIPDSNFDIVLSKSIPVSNPRYSGVIVEKTASGFKISGYDTTNPYFTIIPPAADNNYQIIKVLDQSANYPTKFANYKLSLPYDTELTSVQQLVNFLAGYERYLLAQGFRFDTYDQNLAQIRNWTLSAKEFMFWNHQQWSVGSIIVLSPVAESITFVSGTATVDAISNSFYGSKVVTQNFITLDSDAYSVTRDDRTFSLSLDNTNDLIAFLDIDLVQFEHVLIFDNTTQFNDIIYDPITGQRQYRLKLVGSKTGGWNGRLSPEGFVYGTSSVEQWRAETDYLRGDLVSFKDFYYVANADLPGTDVFNFSDWLPIDKNKIKTGLLNNFARNASMGKDFYNVDKVNLESEFDQYALGLIGYRNRNYLADLGLDDVTQVKFYQGFIKEKGTKNAINALGRADFTNYQNSNVSVDEEWAFRVGAYGSLDTNQFVELVLDENYTLNNPTSLEVVDSSTVVYSSVYTGNQEVYNTATTPWNPPFLLNRTENSVRTDDIQTAGFVNIEDVDYTIFDLSVATSISSNIANVGVGSVVWVAKDYNQTWNVYKVSDTQVTVVEVSNALNGKISIACKTPHKLTKDDTVLIPTAGTYTGFYKVIATPTLTTFIVNYSGSTLGLTQYTTESPMYKLTSLKYTRASDIVYDTPANGWSSNAKVWITDNNDGKWAVYNKTNAWQFNRILPTGEYSSNNYYGASIRLSPDNNFAHVGKPGYDGGIGAVTNYSLSFGGQLRENTTISAIAANTVGMGTSLGAGTANVVIGAPGSASNYGYSFVYNRDYTGKLTKKQILAPSESNGEFGFSIAMGDDDQWVYIGAPGNDSVYVYAYDPFISEEQVEVTKSGFTANLSFTPASTELLFVANATVDFVPYVDYTVSGSQLTFTSDVDSGSIQVVQRPGYRYITKLTGNAGSAFGYSIACASKGQQVIIGAPKTAANIANVSTETGTVSIYDRTIERSIVRSDTYLASANRPLSAVSRVFVNEVLQIKDVDYVVVTPTTVQFFKELTVGTIVDLETDTFNFVQELLPKTPYKNQQFGYSVDFCKNNCSVYVGAPYQSTKGFYNGAVYRFVNQGKVYGKITGDIPATSITPGNSIRINDYEVIFNDSSVTNAINSINNVRIPGITASVSDGYVTITSDSTLSSNRLSVLPGNGDAITQLGFNIFPQTQIIQNSDNHSYDYFGKRVKINTNSDVLFVGSDIANTLELTTFDVGNNLNTTFDTNSTSFKDYIETSGSVWSFNYLPDSRNSVSYPGQFVYGQRLTPYPGLKAKVGFGSAIDVSAYGLLIGSSTDNNAYANAGRVYQFSSPNKLNGWDVYRSEDNKVDISCLLKAYVYSAKDQNIISHLDYIDPAKGKVLGVAEQDITYKTDYDPAVYNNATTDTVSFNSSFFWTNAQVGQVWWDLSTVRYMEYEQGDIKYRTSNWGREFPNSSIDVYEWVESAYPPSQYVARGGDGVPKNVDNSAYVTLTYVETETNKATVKYYFWVKDKTTVSANIFGRTVPTTAIANYIRNPKSSGIKYYAALRDDSIAVYNVNNDTKSKDTVLHIDYATQLNSNIIHSEYALISESSNVNTIPTSVIKKSIDSLSGIDLFGNPVPDPKLSVQNRYGINIRPRQSMVVDRRMAMKEVIRYINSIFAENIISQGFNLTSLASQEPMPSAGSLLFDTSVNTIEELGYIDIIIQPAGYNVLVKSDASVSNLWTIYTKQEDNTWFLSRVQSYRTSDYWKYIDWYAPGFGSTVIPTYTINKLSDMQKLPLKPQDIVKVLNNGQGKWILVQVFADVTVTIGIQDGTVELTDNLYETEKYGLGFGNDNFDNVRFDQNPSIETRQILEAIRDDIFINRLSDSYVKTFFVLLRYILAEQKNIDWAFKTSFVSVLHKFKGLTQPEIYTKENQTYLEQYIDEVKPYRTTVREYVLDYEGVDNFNGYVADFDVPAYYDPILKMYRSPSGEFAEDARALESAQYRDWLLSYSYTIESFDIIDGGSGYTTPPTITITGSTTTNDAVARAIITDGVVTKVEVLYGGSNYISIPEITIEGSNTTPAKLYAKLKNETVRKLKTTLVYDRITYSTEVVDWAPNTSYSAGSIIAYNGVAYQAVKNFTSSSTFSGNYLTIYDQSSFATANDRIQAYYNPALGQPGKDFRLLQTGIDYPGVTVEGLLYAESGSFDISGFDTYVFDPLVADNDGTFVVSDALFDTKLSGGAWDTWPADGSDGTSPDEIIVDGSGVDANHNTLGFVTPYSSHAPEELLPGRVFDTLDITVNTFAVLGNSIEYQTWANVTGFYVQTVTINDGGSGYTTNANAALGESNISVTINGTTGSGAAVNYSLDANGSITSMSIISTGIGYTTIPNVVITGSNTSAASASVGLHQDTFGTFAYRYFKGMQTNKYLDPNVAKKQYTEDVSYIAVRQSSTANLAQDLTLTANTIVVDDASRLTTPNPSGAVPGVVFINGERITYYTKDNSTNTLGQIRRGTMGTGAATHAAGTPVVDGSSRLIVPASSNTIYNSNVSVISQTTSGRTYEFAANTNYISSELWYTQGYGVETLVEEFAANVTANVITTEDLFSISTDQSNLPLPTDGQGLYSSNKIQAVFVKQT